MRDGVRVVEVREGCRGGVWVIAFVEIWLRVYLLVGLASLFARSKVCGLRGISESIR